MPDFDELASYLAGQLEIGTDSVIFDEPWEFSLRAVRASAPAAQSPAVNAPARAQAVSSQPVARTFTPNASARNQAPTTQTLVIPESLKRKTSTAYESATTLDEFYGQISGDAIYAKAAPVRGEGNLNAPRILLVAYLPLEKYGQGFFSSDAGAMLLRLFESLKFKPEEIGMTFFCKKSARLVSAQVALVLRKMLEKEVALIAPQKIVFFGDELLRAVQPRKTLKVESFGGTPFEFAGRPSTALFDPERMLADRNLKVITWKTHVPRSGFFD